MRSPSQAQRSATPSSAADSEWPLIDAIAEELGAVRGGPARPGDSRTARRLLQDAFAAISNIRLSDRRPVFAGRMAG